VELAEYCSNDREEAIEDVLQASSKELEGKSNRDWFNALIPAEREQFSAASGDTTLAILGSAVFSTNHNCVACSSIGLLSGDREIDRKVDLINGELLETIRVLASRFVCGACWLDLNRDELIAVDLPPSFNHMNQVDPVEHFGIDPGD